ncbi:hypothetical protein ACOMHN_011756 [Nucella lapillus]
MPVDASQNASSSFTDDDARGVFTNGPMNEVVFTQGLLSHTSAASVTDCGGKCVSLPGCVSFMFQRIHHTFPEGNCRLHGKFQYVPDDKIVQHGARNFALDSAESKCANKGYFVEEGHCIRVVNASVIYQTASQRCQSLSQGHLFHAMTMTEITFVRKITKNNGFNRVWLGADNLAANGHFQWTDGTPLLTNSSLWASGEPKATAPGGCVVMHAYQHALDDIPCVYKGYVVCQID